jgi:hypothetical protein
VTRVLRAVLGVLAALAGCLGGPPTSLPPSAPAPTGAERLVALAGSVGAMSLVAPGRGSGGGLVPVKATGLPLDAAWLSGSGSELLVTTLGGEVLLNQGPGLSAWVPAPGDLGGGHRLRAFGTLEPAPPAPVAGGRTPRVAVVEGDPGSGGPGRLVIETAAGVVVGQFSLGSVPESAPCWLPDGRVAVVVRDDRDQPTVRLLDPTSGRIGPASGPAVRSIAVAGGIVATLGADGAARAGPITSWPAGGLLPVVAGVDGEVVLQAQPSPSGKELAIVVADVDGDAGSIRVLAAAGGWHEIARFGLPSGANRAVVSWLAAS